MGIAGSESRDGGRRVHMNATAGKQKLEDIFSTVGTKLIKHSSEYVCTDGRFE